MFLKSTALTNLGELTRVSAIRLTKRKSLFEAEDCISSFSVSRVKNKRRHKARQVLAFN